MVDRRISKLVAWYKRNKRDLPWRKTSDPYHIFVSEIMLQQTQVDRVIEFYKRWLHLFPTWKSLANARTDALLHAWAGLGYNRRALHLREAAQQVVANGVPTSVDEWKKLKGVGPYTAAAVHAIVAQKRTVVIDTNVRRVAGRIFLGVPYPGLTHDPAVSTALDRSIPKQPKYWEFPQMLMDFGTAVCAPKQPACASCPLRADCKAAKIFLSGIAGEKPRTVSRERIHRDKKFPDRIYRGRILAAVREGRIKKVQQLGTIIDASFDAKKDSKWLREMILRLERDGMITMRGEKIAIAQN